MQSFFNDLKNRDVIKIIASFLDFVSLGNFLKTSKVINQSCKDFIPKGELSSCEIYKVLKASFYAPIPINFCDIRVINASCFYRPIEVIFYHDDFHDIMREHYFVMGDKKQGYYKSYWWNRNLMEECFYKDDKFDGSYKKYCSNKNLGWECFYKDDKKQGHYKWYWSNGNVGEEISLQKWIERWSKKNI